MTQMIQSFHVTSGAIEALAGELRHQLTLLNDVPRYGGRLSGITTWATACRSATVLWDWVLTDEGAPMVADPLAIRSNLTFGDIGQAPGDDVHVLGINRLVYALPWRQEIKQYLERLRVPESCILTRRPRTARGRNRQSPERELSQRA